MRTNLGLAAAAVLAAGTLGIQSTSVSTAAPAVPVAKAAKAAKAQVATQAGVAASALEALAAHPGQARAAVEQEFTVTDTMVDPDGATHVRMERTFHGLPVIGGDLVVHQNDTSGLSGISQTLKAPLTLPVKAVLGAGSALDKALAPASATRAIANLRASETAPRLVIDARSTIPRLAWETLTVGRHADGTPSRLTSYIDARTGTVLRRVEAIHTADGQGVSLYSGTVPISVTLASGKYALTDAAHGNAKTTDMANKEDSVLCTIFGSGCTNGVAYSSADNSFGSGTTANRESAAVDAHYGGAVTFDYFKLVLGRNGIFGTGAGAPSRVHYGSGYVNAFWDGTKMTYGDGDGVNYGPLVSLDVAGHEMSHGVTENTANLTYSGESGGLNEATSDIFGTMVEFYANNANDPGDYLIGEEFDATHQGLRRMDNPASDGSSYNCYATGIGNADVHYSSGLGNHFYYLLAEGSGAKTIGGVAHNSSTCNGSSVTGIGRDAAQKIWFRALTTYFTSGTTYAQARTGTLNAAKDLYGTGSAQYNAVAAAWSAVSVN